MNGKLPFIIGIGLLISCKMRFFGENTVNAPLGISHVGNGGGDFDSLVAQGRYLSTQLADNFNLNNMNPSIRNDAAEWIRFHARKVPQTLKNLQWKFETKNNYQLDCASSYDGFIHFIKLNCEKYTDSKQLSELIIHEVAHLLGVKNESMAAEIARAYALQLYNSTRFEPIQIRNTLGSFGFDTPLVPSSNFLLGASAETLALQRWVDSYRLYILDDFQNPIAPVGPAVPNFNRLAFTFLTSRTEQNLTKYFVVWGGCADNMVISLLPSLDSSNIFRSNSCKKLENSGFYFNQNETKWNALPDSPLEPKLFPKSIGFENGFLIWGGEHENNSLSTDFGAAIFEFQKNKWSSIDIHPSDNVIDYKGSLIVNRDGDLFEINLKTMHWTKLPTPNCDCSLQLKNSAMILLDDEIVIVGEKVALMYHMEKSEWSLPIYYNGPVFPSKPSLAAQGKKVYILGGFIRGTNSEIVPSSNIVFQLDVVKREWSSYSNKSLEGRQFSNRFLWTGSEFIGTTWNERAYSDGVEMIATSTSNYFAFNPFTLFRN